MPMGTQVSGALSQATKWARGAKTTTTRGSTRTAGGAIFRPKTSLSTGTSFGGGLTRRAQFAAGGAAATTAAGGAMAVANGNKDLDVSKAFAEDYAIAKAEGERTDRPSTQRRLAAAVGGGYHPVIAGKKGHKARALGTTLGNAYAGGALGAGGGAALGLGLSAASRGRIPAAPAGISGAYTGGAIGAQAGVQRAVGVNHRKGRLKEDPNQKPVAKSLGIAACWLED